jgi:hypothetical protein
MTTVDELRRASLDELERLYRESPVGPAPSGLYRGELLRWLDTRGARRPSVRAADRTSNLGGRAAEVRLATLVEWALFEAPRWGVDFARRRWWFVRPALAAGRFTATYGPSRWRETDTFRLEYGESRLPVRALLYDEVKPLGADLCLGIGGLNAERGEGDHFFFALYRWKR